jgi:hypothetical protein
MVDLALGPGTPSMPLEAQVHQGEPDPRALEDARLVEPRERLEEPVGIPPVETDAVFPDDVPGSVRPRLRVALVRRDLSRTGELRAFARRF